MTAIWSSGVKVRLWSPLGIPKNDQNDKILRNLETHIFGPPMPWVMRLWVLGCHWLGPEGSLLWARCSKGPWTKVSLWVLTSIRQDLCWAIFCGASEPTITLQIKPWSYEPRLRVHHRHNHHYHQHQHQHQHQHHDHLNLYHPFVSQQFNVHTT